MEWRAKQMVSTKHLTHVSGALYGGQLIIWNAVDAHGDVFTRQTKFHVHGEPPVYLEHNYFAPPVGKIVHFSEQDEGLYVAIKLERPIEDMNGLHLSVGGFVIGEPRSDGVFEIKEMAVFEASLTQTPAQPNSELRLLMKMLTETDMTTENEKAPLENASGQATQKVAPTSSSQATQKVTPTPSALGYLRKQDLEQLESYVIELGARVEALEALPAQLAELQKRVADLEAAVAQIQGMTQESVAQSVEKALKAVQEQVQPLAKELAKTMLLVSEALKKTNTQRI